jgi:hypothetical protein
MTDRSAAVGRRQLLVAGGLGVVAGALGGRSSAVAAPSGFSEHRTAAQLVLDGQQVRRQVEALSSSQARGRLDTIISGVEPEPQPDQPDQVFGINPWALWSGTSFAAPQISGAVARLCGETPTLSPRAGLAALLAGRPVLPGYGNTVRLLSGTPIG